MIECVTLCRHEILHPIAKEVYSYAIQKEMNIIIITASYLMFSLVLLHRLCSVASC